MLYASCCCCLLFAPRTGTINDDLLSAWLSLDFPYPLLARHSVLKDLSKQIEVVEVGSAITKMGRLVVWGVL